MVLCSYIFFVQEHTVSCEQTRLFLAVALNNGFLEGLLEILPHQIRTFRHELRARCTIELSETIDQVFVCFAKPSDPTPHIVAFLAAPDVNALTIFAIRLGDDARLLNGRWFLAVVAGKLALGGGHLDQRVLERAPV